MGRPQRRAQRRLKQRIAAWENRETYARQAAGGDKLVPMLNRPGSQNRNKK